MSPPTTTAAAAGIDNTTRKKWDKSEYAAKALQRVEEEDKKKPKASDFGLVVKQPLTRENMIKRDFKKDLESKGVKKQDKLGRPLRSIDPNSAEFKKVTSSSQALNAYNVHNHKGEKENYKQVKEILEKNSVHYDELGIVLDKDIIIDEKTKVSIDDLIQSNNNWLKKYMDS